MEKEQTFYYLFSFCCFEVQLKSERVSIGKIINHVLFFQVFINEVDNDCASQAVEIVLNYIKKNPSLGLSVQLMTIEGNRTDSKKFLENSEFFYFSFFFELVSDLFRTQFG